MNQHRLRLFFPLAFPLSWYPWALVLVRGSGNPGPNPPGIFAAALNVLLQMLFHASVNAMRASLVFRMFSDTERVGLWYVHALL